MAMIQIVYTVSFQFIDVCDEHQLAENWNTEDHSLIGLRFRRTPSETDFVEQLTFETEKVRYQVDPMPVSIREGLIYLAQGWYERNKAGLDKIVSLEPWWFGVATHWSTRGSPWTLPKPKPKHDKRARLHLQFA